MSLAIGWDTASGAPTVPFFIVLGVVLTACTIGVVLALRWHDQQDLKRRRQRRAQAEKPVLAKIDQNSRVLDEILAIANENYGSRARPALKMVKGDR